MNMLEDGVSLYATVKYWVAEFKRGGTRIINKQHSGYPKTATTEEIINFENRWLTLCKIAVAPNILITWLKFSDEKPIRAIFQQYFGWFRKNKNWFFGPLVCNYGWDLGLLLRFHSES